MSPELSACPSLGNIAQDRIRLFVQDPDLHESLRFENKRAEFSKRFTQFIISWVLAERNNGLMKEKTGSSLETNPFVILRDNFGANTIPAKYGIGSLETVDLNKKSTDEYKNAVKFITENCVFEELSRLYGLKHPNGRENDLLQRLGNIAKPSAPEGMKELFGRLINEHFTDQRKNHKGSVSDTTRDEEERRKKVKHEERRAKIEELAQGLTGESRFSPYPNLARIKEAICNIKPGETKSEAIRLAESLGISHRTLERYRRQFQLNESGEVVRKNGKPIQ